MNQIRHTLEDHLAVFRPESDRMRMPLDMSVDDILTHLSSEHERAYIATLPQLPHEMLTEMLHDSSEWVRSASFCNPNVTEDEIKEAIQDTCPLVRAAAATSHNAPPWLLDELAKDQDQEVLQAVVLNPNTNPETLVGLLDREDLKQDVAENANLPQDQLPKLWNESTLARAGVAANPMCPVYLLIEGLTDPSPDVRRAAARNLGVPEPAMDVAVKHSLLFMAQARIAEEEALAELEMSTVERKAKPHQMPQVLGEQMDESGVKIAPGSQLTDVLKTSEDEARERQEAEAMKALEQQQRLAEQQKIVAQQDHLYLQFERERAVIEGALQNKRCSERVMMTVMESNETDLKCIAAMNPAATTNSLNKALAQPEAEVRMSAVSNPNASAEVLFNGIRSDPKHLEKIVAQSPRATPEMLEEIYERNLKVEREIFQEKGKLHQMDSQMRQEVYQCSEIRDLVMQNPNVSPELLKTAMKDPRNKVRLTAINNVRANMQVLQKALQDKMRIKQAAMQKMAQQGLAVGPDGKVIKPHLAEGKKEAPLVMPETKESADAHLYVESENTNAPAQDEGAKMKF